MEEFNIFDFEPLLLLRGISKENGIKEHKKSLEFLLEEELPDEKIKEYTKIKEILEKLEEKGYHEIDNALTEEAKGYMDKIQNEDMYLNMEQEVSFLILKYLDTASSFKKTDDNYTQLVRLYSSFDSDKSFENFKKAIEINPENGEPHVYMGLTKLKSSLEEDEYKKAIDHFEKAIEKGYDDFFVYFYLGVTNYLLKDYESASNNYKKAEKFLEEGDKKIPNFLEQKAKLKFALNDYKGAAEYINEAHKLKAKSNKDNSKGMYV